MSTKNDAPAVQAAPKASRTYRCLMALGLGHTPEGHPRAGKKGPVRSPVPDVPTVYEHVTSEELEGKDVGRLIEVGAIEPVILA